MRWWLFKKHLVRVLNSQRATKARLGLCISLLTLLMIRLWGLQTFCVPLWYHRLLLVVAVSTEVCRGGVQLVFGGFLIDRYYHKHQHPWNIGSLARPKGTHVRVPIYELMGICVRGSAWIDGHQRRRGTDICHERPAEMHKHKKKLLQLKTPPWD